MRRNRPEGRRKRYRGCGGSRQQVEALEARVLLSGLTIITHGAEFLSTSRPAWIDAMAVAIRNRMGPDTAIYELRMEPSNGAIVATSFARLAGPAPGAGSNDETVLLLDWAAASGVNLLGLSANYSTTAVAAAVMPYLTTAIPAIGLNAPLVEGSIQLIGHSRGASLVSELANDLGQSGIWVDQLTTLDPVPVPPDPAVTVRSNVIFADNYWQNSGDGVLVPNGTAINGAYNVGPLTLGGAEGVADGQTHGDVHLFYDGTINTSMNAGDGSATVVNSWYANNGLNRMQTGFYYSRLGGGSANQPLTGISTAFGGTGARAGITHSGAQYANLATITLATYTLSPGATFTASYRYGSYNTGATITWYLDPDTNPYNNNSIPVGTSTVISATGDNVIKATATFTAPGTSGTYYLEGVITNTTGTRYAYSSAIGIHNVPPVGAIEKVTQTAITGWAGDPDTPGTAVTIHVTVDGVAFYTGTAGLAHAKDALGTSNGFAVDLSALTAGRHRVDLYADDTTTGVSTLVASKMVNTNVAPMGVFESFANGVLTGWASDPNDGANASQIMYQIDNNAPVLAVANLGRAGLPLNSSNHGFAIALPQLTAGQHWAKVWAVDSTSGTLRMLGERSMVVHNPAGDILPRGGINVATTGQVTGWAWDAATRKVPLMVRVDVDGVAGTPVLANAARKDLQAMLGGTNFGFSVALTLGAGEHRIDLYALDPTTGTAVLIGSRIVKPVVGPGAAAPVGALETVSASILAGWTWAAAVAGDSALYRLDIDGVAGVVSTTNVQRDDVNATYATSGTYGFSVATSDLLAGRHTVALVYVDPLTLVATTVVTKSLVTG